MPTISAPPLAGDDLLRPVLDKLLKLYPEASAHLMLLDRPVTLVEEGVDIALRVAQLAESSLIATRVDGDIRWVVIAAPEYLVSAPPLEEPSDLAAHRIITFTNFRMDSWTFAPAAGQSVPRTVSFQLRLAANTVRATLRSAIAEVGVTRHSSNHVAEAVAARQLRIVPAHAQHPPLPVHLLTSAGRASIP